MATKRPYRRRQQLEIEPLNWVAPDARAPRSEERVELDEQEHDNKEKAKN